MYNVLSDLNVVGSLVISDNKTDFPVDAPIGSLIIKNECLYGYLNIGNLKTWYPLGVKTSSFVHMQGLPSSQWVINHELKSRDVWFQIKDSNSNIVYPSSSMVIDENTLVINFSYAITGVVVVVASSMVDTPTIRTTKMLVGDGVEIGGDFVTINGETVLTKAAFNVLLDSGEIVEFSNTNPLVITGDPSFINVTKDTNGALKVSIADELKNSLSSLDQRIDTRVETKITEMNFLDGGVF